MKDIFDNWNKYKHIIQEQKETVSSSTETKTIKLPKFRISEQWGTPGSDDRKIIDMFMNDIKGNTFVDKVNSLNDFINKCGESCMKAKDIPEIISSLVFLDSLSSIIYDFNDKTGGFLFEAIVSALIGGEQVETIGGPNQELEDILDAQGNPMSLKFNFAGPKYITGSPRNARVSIEKFKQPMKYLVALKNRKHKTGEVLSIDFYEFTVGTENYPGDFDAYDLGDRSIYTTNLGNFKVATLDFGSRENMKKIAEAYTARLGDSITEIYNGLDSLSNNINLYFVESEKGAAIKARKDAMELKQDVDDLA